jgi:colanic acid biosynthesis glycosyl transferase WcaI
VSSTRYTARRCSCAQEKSEIVFCFIGGGSEQAKVRESGLSNVKCLPYQPLNELSSSLSAADLHVVVMGEKFVGIVHPCKVYNICRSARRFYTSAQSRVTSLTLRHNMASSFSRHGDVDAVVRRSQNANEFRNGSR